MKDVRAPSALWKVQDRAYVVFEKKNVSHSYYFSNDIKTFPRAITNNSLGRKCGTFFFSFFCNLFFWSTKLKIIHLAVHGVQTVGDHCSSSSFFINGNANKISFYHCSSFFFFGGGGCSTVSDIFENLVCFLLRNEYCMVD